MEIKANPQGYLIYAAMVGYLSGFVPALLTTAVRFQEHLKAMGRRAIVFGLWLFVALSILACLVAGGFWIKYHAFPLKILFIAFPVFVLVFVVLCLIGLGAMGLSWIYRKLLGPDVERLRRLTVFLTAVTIVCLSIAGACIGGAYALRWYSVRHVPLQNLFEVFLTLGLLVIPISMFCRCFLGIRSLATDLLLGVFVLLPAGFVFNAEPQQLPPALQSWLFVPHVAVYMLSYLFMAKAALQAIFQTWTHGLIEDNLRYEHSTYSMVRIGFPLLTLGLVLGSYWGKKAWGDYWSWDPKELWSLASWLVFVGYFHFRYMFGKKYPRINSLWAIAGMTAIVITLLWVNLSRLFPGLHSYAT
jgi:ABC-type transport system involved in cytochrome c biogenesis permease subunit